jgi:hypothetical protein
MKYMGRRRRRRNGGGGGGGMGEEEEEEWGRRNYHRLRKVKNFITSVFIYLITK